MFSIPPARFLPILFVLGVTACAEHAPRPAGEAGTTAFVGVSVIPMVEADVVLSDQTVLINDDRIVIVGPRRDVPIPPDAVRIDGSNRYLMPGLADMHVHLEYFDDPSVLDLFLANGVTTVRNMDGRPYINEWREKVANGALVGPTIVTAGPILDGSPPMRDDNTAVSNPAEAEAAVEEQARSGYDFIKVYTNLDAETYDAIIRLAAERDLPVAGHVPRFVDIGDALHSGQRSIEHLADYDSLVESDDSPFRNDFHWSKLYLAMPIDSNKLRDAARKIATAGVWTTATAVQADRAVVPMDEVQSWLSSPSMAYIEQGARDFWESSATRNNDRMDSSDWQLVSEGRSNRLSMIGALANAGAGLLIGTDTPNPFVVPGFSIHEELENFVSAGIAPGRVLQIATRDAALYLHVLDEVGTVEAGKRADLLLVDGNPLDDLSRVRQPLGVMVRGRWLSREELQRRLEAMRDLANAR